MTNELDTSWHTSSHSRQAPTSVPSGTSRRRGSGPGRRGSGPGRRGSGASGAAAAMTATVKDEHQHLQSLHGSMSSVEEDCGVTESTRTLSVETHGNYNHHHHHPTASGKQHHDGNDSDADDDDEDDDVDSFGETAPTDRTDAEKLQKCLASGVSKRLMDFRINYDSKANFDLEDDDDLDDHDDGNVEHAKKKDGHPKKPKNRIMGSMAKALRRVAHLGGGSNHRAHQDAINTNPTLSSSHHQKK